eukprot:1160814-Pelagomonas_calceolata.AAC.16
MRAQCSYIHTLAMRPVRLLWRDPQSSNMCTVLLLTHTCNALSALPAVGLTELPPSIGALKAATAAAAAAVGVREGGMEKGAAPARVGRSVGWEGCWNGGGWTDGNVRGTATWAMMLEMRAFRLSTCMRKSACGNTC